MLSVSSNTFHFRVLLNTDFVNQHYCCVVGERSVREKYHYQKSEFKMKFIIVAVFVVICLAVDVPSTASVMYSISNETLTVAGTADVNLNISIESVWDSLSNGKKH